MEMSQQQPDHQVQTSSPPSSSWQLPILDIEDWKNLDTRESFVQDLKHACHSVGFFLLRHDLPAPVVQSAVMETRHFFQNHTLAQKMQISYEDQANFRGYMAHGVENTAGQIDAREQVEYAVEEQDINIDNDISNKEPSDKSAILPYYNRLKGQNPWPDAFQPTLRPAILDYVTNMCRIGDCIRYALCMALGLPPTALNELFGDDDESRQADKTSATTIPAQEPPYWVLKMVSYPSNQQDQSSMSPHVMGVGAHTDTNFLTLILQDDDAKDNGGAVLQVYSQGEWRTVVIPTQPATKDPAVDRFLICNLGEQAQVWSRSYLLATPHRVIYTKKPSSRIINSVRDDDDQNQNKEPSDAPFPRISLPLFYNPRLSAVIEPLEESIVDAAAKADIQTSDHDAMAKHALLPNNNTTPWKDCPKPNAMLQSVGENTFKSLARSHPAVFQRHHPDLQVQDDGRIVQVSPSR